MSVDLGLCRNNNATSHRAKIPPILGLVMMAQKLPPIWNFRCVCYYCFLFIYSFTLHVSQSLLPKASADLGLCRKLTCAPIAQRCRHSGNLIRWRKRFRPFGTFVAPAPFYAGFVLLSRPIAFPETVIQSDCRPGTLVRQSSQLLDLGAPRHVPSGIDPAFQKLVSGITIRKHKGFQLLLLLLRLLLLLLLLHRFRLQEGESYLHFTRLSAPPAEDVIVRLII